MEKLMIDNIGGEGMVANWVFLQLRQFNRLINNEMAFS